jgi:hypothetical protein
VSPEVGGDGSPSTPKVFICYRREESAAHAGRLHDAMVARFGEDNVFMDVALAPGVDFVKRIQEAVAGCHVVIVVMGPRWATIEDENGGKRIADPEDFVRLEVEAGLGRPDVTLIPVLVSGARMPKREDLPPEVDTIARRNALELSEMRWRYDVGRLNETLDRLLSRADGEGEARADTREGPTPLVPHAGRSVFEGTLVAGAAAFVARLLSDAIEKPPAHTDTVDFVTRLSLVRAITWAAVGIALAIWLALRARRAAEAGRFATYGLLFGAIGGALGGAIWALPVELADLDPKGNGANWIELASLAVTGAFVGALLGWLWPSHRVGASLASGFLAGAATQWIFISTEATISQPLKYGIVAAAVAALTLAVLAFERQRAGVTTPPPR